MERHKRKSIRLRNYDYSRKGCYFITVCAYNREVLFGDVRRGTTCCALNEIGKAVKKFWTEIPNHFPNVDLDEYIVMPNHIHGILVRHWGAPYSKRVQHVEPLQNEY